MPIHINCPHETTCLPLLRPYRGLTKWTSVTTSLSILFHSRQSYTIVYKNIFIFCIWNDNIHSQWIPIEDKSNTNTTRKIRNKHIEIIKIKWNIVLRFYAHHQDCLKCKNASFFMFMKHISDILLAALVLRQGWGNGLRWYEL
jgi:hypothetical protein